MNNDIALVLKRRKKNADRHSLCIPLRNKADMSDECGAKEITVVLVVRVCTSMSHILFPARSTSIGCIHSTHIGVPSSTIHWWSRKKNITDKVADISHYSEFRGRMRDRHVST